MTQLPPGWTVRPPTLDDVPAILEMVHASDIVAVGEPDTSADEVAEILTAPNQDPALDSWLVFDDAGRLVGWAYVENPLSSPREWIEAYVHPELGRPAHPALVELAVARVARRAAERDVPSFLVRAGAVASETEYIGVLQAAGFSFVKRYARMRRDLADLPPVPVPPHGVVVRPVRPEDETEMRAFHEVLDVAFRDTPDYEPSTYESFRQRIDAMPSIDWSEWFVVQAEGSGIAAILQSSVEDDDNNEGWVRYLAVRREFRGQGLGRLLLLTAFATYAGKGRTAVGLGVDLTNPTSAYRLYESVGLHPFYEVDILERTVSAA